MSCDINGMTNDTRLHRETIRSLVKTINYSYHHTEQCVQMVFLPYNVS